MANLSFDFGGDTKAILDCEVKKLTSGSIAARYERANGTMLYRILTQEAYKKALSEVAELSDTKGWTKQI